MANDPTFSLDPKKGGMNWGYCKMPTPTVNKGKGDLVKYEAVVETSDSPGSETK